MKPALADELANLWAAYQSESNIADANVGAPSAPWGTLQSTRTENSDDQLRDLVDCSVFASPEIRSFQKFTIQVLLHERGELIRAARMAQGNDGCTNRRGFASLATQIPRGSIVEVFAESDYFSIIDPLQQVRWDGLPVCVPITFELLSKPGVVLALSRLYVSLNDMLIGELSFAITIASALLNRTRETERSKERMGGDEAPICDGSSLKPVGVESTTYARAFISYARKDFEQASLFAQGLAEHRIQLCMDVTTFEPGDDWAHGIEDQIKNADVFYLIWSSNAAASKWVNREAEFAVRLNEASGRRKPRIKPITLERPSPRPPDFLSRFHFDSPWLSQRSAQKISLFKQYREQRRK
jgi:hypothetical protein